MRHSPSILVQYAKNIQKPPACSLTTPFLAWPCVENKFADAIDVSVLECASMKFLFIHITILCADTIF